MPGGRRSIEVQGVEVRIVEDISALVRVLEKIVENEGACLLHAFYRSGRREMSMFGQRELTSRPRTHSRIATLAPLAASKFLGKVDRL